KGAGRAEEGEGEPGGDDAVAEVLGDRLDRGGGDQGHGEAGGVAADQGGQGGAGAGEITLGEVVVHRPDGAVEALDGEGRAEEEGFGGDAGGAEAAAEAEVGDGEEGGGGG